MGPGLVEHLKAEEREGGLAQVRECGEPHRPGAERSSGRSAAAGRSVTLHSWRRPTLERGVRERGRPPAAGEPHALHPPIPTSSTAASS